MQDSLTKFQIREVDSTSLVLTCHGGLSWEDRELLAGEVQRYLEPRSSITGLVLDMAKVEFVNSAGLGAIFSLRKHAQSGGSKLVLARPSPAIRRLLETVNVQALMPIADDLDEARRLAEKSD